MRRVHLVPAAICQYRLVPEQARQVVWAEYFYYRGALRQALMQGIKAATLILLADQHNQEKEEHSSSKEE